jgi:hypothetical protein
MHVVWPGDPFFPSPAVNAIARASDNYVTVYAPLNCKHLSLESNFTVQVAEALRPWNCARSYAVRILASALANLTRFCGLPLFLFYPNRGNAISLHM